MRRAYFLFMGISIFFIFYGCNIQSNLSEGDEANTDNKLMHVFGDPELKMIYVSAPKGCKVKYVLAKNREEASKEQFKPVDNYTGKTNENLDSSLVLYQINNTAKNPYLKITIEGVAQANAPSNSTDTTKASESTNSSGSQSPTTSVHLDITIVDSAEEKPNCDDKTEIREIEFKPNKEGETTTTSSNYECYKTDQAICEIEAVIFRETNAYRKRWGLGEFKPSVSVSYVARDWSQKQARSGGISHYGFSGSRWAVLQTLKSNSSLDTNQIKFLSRENVAMNYVRGSSEATGKAFTDQWIHSDGHRDNILAQSKYLGVGVAARGNGAYYATQIFAN